MIEHASNETFIKLLENHIKHKDGRPGKIRIPIIQRDYAQGRNNAATKEKLVKLLADIKAAVQRDGKQPLSLNFVYGKIDNGCFEPLDGQQRLTLLFLLHVYAFADGEDEDDCKSKTALLERFEYKTRVSSQDFIEKLVETRKEFFGAARRPRKLASAAIKNSPWFLPQWEHDPTIASMLAVVDKIVEAFPENDDRLALASALQDGSITFKFLNMDKLGLPDSLYIKLNARGKQLSHFENFRAKMIARVEALDKEEAFSGFKPYGEHGDDGCFSKLFEICLDGDWTDIFWRIARKEKEDKKSQLPIDYFFDSAFETFIRNVLRNRLMWSGAEPEAKSAEEDKRINVDQLEPQALLDLYYTLQVLREADLWDGAILDCTQSEQYANRIRLFALTVYANQTAREINESLDEWRTNFEPWNNGFKKWYRIFKNLVLNSEYNSLLIFYQAIRYVGKLSPECRTIENFFAESTEFDAEQHGRIGFYGYQINEERLKARLIINGGEDFRTVIEQAERHPYFSGQITGILSFADFSLDKQEGLEEKLRNFKFYTDLIEIMFKAEEPAVDGVLLRRALLTLGDYRIKAENESLDTFVRDKPSHSTSWKGLLRTDKNKAERDLLKILFDLCREEPHETSVEIENVLKKMIGSSNVDKDDWRYYFIDKDQLLAQDSDESSLFLKNFIGHTYWRSTRPDEKENPMILFRSTDYRGYYWEFHLLVVFRHFRRKGWDIKVHGGYVPKSEDCRIEGIKSPNGDLVVKYSYNTKGLAIVRADGTSLEPPMEGKAAEEVIRYLDDED